MENLEMHVSVPSWLSIAINRLSSEEGYSKDDIVYDAVVEHIRAVAPEIIPEDLDFRTERSMSIRLLNKILSDSINMDSDTIELSESNNLLRVRHWRAGQLAFEENFASRWLRPITQRVKFMSRQNGSFAVQRPEVRRVFHLDFLTQESLVIRSRK